MKNCLKKVLSLQLNFEVIIWFNGFEFPFKSIF